MTKGFVYLSHQTVEKHEDNKYAILKIGKFTSSDKIKVKNKKFLVLAYCENIEPVIEKSVQYLINEYNYIKKGRFLYNEDKINKAAQLFEKSIINSKVSRHFVKKDEYSKRNITILKKRNDDLINRMFDKINM